MKTIRWKPRENSIMHRQCDHHAMDRGSRNETLFWTGALFFFISTVNYWTNESVGCQLFRSLDGIQINCRHCSIPYVKIMIDCGYVFTYVRICHFIMKETPVDWFFWQHIFLVVFLDANKKLCLQRQYFRSQWLEGVM